MVEEPVDERIDQRRGCRIERGEERRDRINTIVLLRPAVLARKKEEAVNVKVSDG